MFSGRIRSEGGSKGGRRVHGERRHSEGRFGNGKIANAIVRLNQEESCAACRISRSSTYREGSAARPEELRGLIRLVE